MLSGSHSLRLSPLHSLPVIRVNQHISPTLFFEKSPFPSKFCLIFSAKNYLVEFEIGAFLAIN